MELIQDNDLTAPRFNARKSWKNVIDKELWWKWKRDNKKKLTWKEFQHTWWKLAWSMRDLVIEERDGIRIRGIGDVYIAHIKMETRIPDHAASKKYGKRIYIESWTNQGLPLKIFYITSNKKLRRRWKFFGERDFTRGIKKAMVIDPYRYKYVQHTYKPIEYYEHRRELYLRSKGLIK